LLDHLKTYFIRQKNFYIRSQDLYEFFKITCENIEIPFDPEKYLETILILEKYNFLQPSRKMSNLKPDNKLFCENFFISINPYNLTLVLNKIDEIQNADMIH